MFKWSDGKVYEGYFKNDLKYFFCYVDVAKED